MTIWVRAVMLIQHANTKLFFGLSIGRHGCDITCFPKELNHYNKTKIFRIHWSILIWLVEHSLILCVCTREQMKPWETEQCGRILVENIELQRLVWWIEYWLFREGSMWGSGTILPDHPYWSNFLTYVKEKDIAIRAVTILRSRIFEPEQTALSTQPLG